MATIISQSISDIEMEILKHDIYDENNESNPLSLWISGSIRGKVNNCYKRMQSEWIPKLMADSNVVAISASRDDFSIAIRSALLQKGAKQKFSLFFLICLSILIRFGKPNLLE